MFARRTFEPARAAEVEYQRVPAEFLQEACIPPTLNEQRRIVAKVEMFMEQVREARRYAKRSRMLIVYGSPYLPIPFRPYRPAT